jgi:hypothetical protein
MRKFKNISVVCYNTFLTDALNPTWLLITAADIQLDR